MPSAADLLFVGKGIIQVCVIIFVVLNRIMMVHLKTDADIPVPMR